MSRTGKLVMLCTSNKAGLPKFPVASAIVAAGLAGDFHAGETRISRTTGQEKFNDRQLTVVGREALSAFNAELGIHLVAGSLGENLLVEGFGDLSQIQPRSRLEISGPDGRVLIRVVAQNQPCANLQVYHRRLVKVAYGRRGLLCVVERGTGCRLEIGRPVELLDPD